MGNCQRCELQLLELSRQHIENSGSQLYTSGNSLTEKYCLKPPKRETIASSKVIFQQYLFITSVIIIIFFLFLFWCFFVCVLIRFSFPLWQKHRGSVMNGKTPKIEIFAWNKMKSRSTAFFRIKPVNHTEVKSLQISVGSALYFDKLCCKFYLKYICNLL